MLCKLAPRCRDIAGFSTAHPKRRVSPEAMKSVESAFLLRFEPARLFLSGSLVISCGPASVCSVPCVAATGLRPTAERPLSCIMKRLDLVLHLHAGL